MYWKKLAIEHCTTEEHNQVSDRIVLYVFILQHSRLWLEALKLLVRESHILWIIILYYFRMSKKFLFTFHSEHPMVFEELYATATIALLPRPI